MSIGKVAFKGAAWLSLFKLASQMFSWVITILVARILIPNDYGLMAMATILTGYISSFVEMGLGSSIIQRDKITKNELSSLFWFLMLLSFVLALVCFIGARFMAHIFKEPRIVPMIHAISIIFPMNGLMIIPMALLKRNLNFKNIGLIGLLSVIASCICTYLIACKGGGVWALVGGSIALCLSKLILVYYNVRWFPRLHFKLKELKSYMTFGVQVFAGKSFFYAFGQSDKFFAGRMWSSQILGYYSFALQLAQLPTEKIVVLINQISFPVFSRLQNDKLRFNEFYLNILKITATLTIPVFVGGYLVGDEIILLLLNEKWYPIIFVFKCLCLTQIMTALNAVNSFVHYAQGRPQWSLYFHMILATLMAFSFYYAVRFGLNAIIIPWFTTYIIICAVWIIVTLRKIGIPITAYLRRIINPIIATFILATAITLHDRIVDLFLSQNVNMVFLLATRIVLGITIYLGYFWIFDRQLFYDLKKLRKS